MIALNTEKYYPALGKMVWGLNGFVALIMVFMVTGSNSATIEFGLLMGLVLSFVSHMHIDTMYGREIERLKNRVENLEEAGEDSGE